MRTGHRMADHHKGTRLGGGGGALHRVLLGAVSLVIGWGAMAQVDEGPSMVPEAFPLNEIAAKALDAEWLTGDERRDMRIFHGVWDERDLDTPQRRAIVALNAWNFDDPSLSDEGSAPEIRAEARLRSGEPAEALAILEGAASSRAARIRAESLEMLGQAKGADEAVDEPVERMLAQGVDDAAELTEAVRAMFVRARLQGQPARDFQSMMSLLGRAHQELDRLYWPARLAEAEILLDKDNAPEAVAALHEALSLNPRSADAWFMLGTVALSRFDFTSADNAVEALRRLNDQHPLADLLAAESRLVQDDPEGAIELLDPLLARLPRLRPALALHAAAMALLYDDARLDAALARYEALSPGSAQPYYIVGKHLSMNRQYAAAAEALEEAIRRQPSWASPQIELGLMELQSGRDDRALRLLQQVVKLDPFNKRAANSLYLLEDLATFKQYETEHFIVRCKPGVDEAMAEMMLEALERIHRTVSTRFDHEPAQKTIIELMPDHQRFAVRITGMPFVHTIAACTGPVIAMEPPREGPRTRHHGLFDWPRVIQHEYTHTITLDQTRNRIPHWLTEAAAVSMEMAPRSYSSCKLLADAYAQGTLFNLEEIKWAFIRPKRPTDRAKAYAQGHWMVEFMNERFGESALIRLLERYFEGEREQQAMPKALGVSREQFYRDFLEWAGGQVTSWGLGVKPTVTELLDEVRNADPQLTEAMNVSRQARLDVIVRTLTNQIGMPSRRRSQPLTADRWPPLIRPPVDVTDEMVARWLERFPDHPDVVELQIRRRLDRIGEDIDPNDQELIALLERYATLRPVDPLPHRRLALMYLSGDSPQSAIEHLEALDAIEEHSPVHALKLADLYRVQNDFPQALAKITRAVHIHPYSASIREQAAAIAIQAGDLPLARRHIIALTLLEPDRPQHARRLAAIDAKIAQSSN